jgi:hypothetical protein
LVSFYRSNNDAKADREQRHWSEPGTHASIDDLIICEELVFGHRGHPSGIFHWRLPDP